MMTICAENPKPYSSPIDGDIDHAPGRAAHNGNAALEAY
jgi:hypothetical protein